MASYTPPDSRIPSSQRTVRISNVVSGDLLDFREILGRPANGVQIFMADAGDTIAYNIVTYVTIRKRKEGSAFLNPVYECYGIRDDGWELIEETLYSDDFSNAGANFALSDEIIPEGLYIKSVTGTGSVEIICW